MTTYQQIIDRPIKTIIGHEPMREREYPTLFQVGIPIRHDEPPVEQITYREANYGDHGLGWFDAHAGGKVIASLAARAVAEIHYAEARS